MKFVPLLPKTKTQGQERGGLIFCSVEEGMKKFLSQYPAGKVLFVADESSLASFCAVRQRRALGVVLDSRDGLPLFSVSDDVALVAAAGSAHTIRAARFFADVRKTPCAAFPSSAALDGVFEREGDVYIRDCKFRVPLAESRLFCDWELVKKSLGGAYMRLLLSRLALVENGALQRFGITPENGACEQARSFLSLPSLAEQLLSPEEIVLKNAALRESESAGMNRGEGVVLADSIGQEGEARAYLLLSALYSAFFRKGKPRCVIPDYAARAKRAGALYAEQAVPSPQEYAARSMAFERMQDGATAELNAMRRAENAFKKNYYRLTGEAFPQKVDLAPLATLPEKVKGLCCVIRDFGLMEWISRDGDNIFFDGDFPKEVDNDGHYGIQ